MAWVSLDADDNEPGRFWTYVCTAVSRARPGAGEAALGLLRSASPPPQMVLITLINDLARADQHLAIVLDDYHEIHLAAAHDGRRFLLAYLPPKVHVVIATRAFSRSQVLLYLVYCQARRIGSGGTPGRLEPRRASRFLGSLPQKLLERIDATRGA